MFQQLSKALSIVLLPVFLIGVYVGYLKLIKAPIMEENFTSLSVVDFKNELENTEAVLLDVRTQPELDRFGIISENQIHIDIYQSWAAEEIQKLDVSKKYLIYCYHGNRTKQVQDFMKQAWFSYVKDLDWGIDAWIQSWEETIRE